MLESNHVNDSQFAVEAECANGRKSLLNINFAVALEKFWNSTGASAIFVSLLSLSFVAVYWESQNYLAVTEFLGDFRNAGTPKVSDAACNSVIGPGGWWVNSTTAQFELWQPRLCMMTVYSNSSFRKCAKTHRIFFIGDSVARGLYNGIVDIAGRDTDRANGHTDSALMETAPNITNSPDCLLSFHWDPFLNNTRLADLIAGLNNPQVKPVFVMAAGYWHIKHFESINQAQTLYIDALTSLIGQFTELAKSNDMTFYLVPIASVVESKLQPNRSMIKNDLIERLNSGIDTLYLTAKSSHSFTRSSIFMPSSLSDSISQAMLSMSEDGLHLKSYTGVANILLNHICNRQLFSNMTATPTSCCIDYPIMSWKQSIVIGLGILFGPLAYCYFQLSKSGGVTYESLLFKTYFRDLSKHTRNITWMIIAALTCYLADRTDLLVKYRKQYDILVSPTILGSALFVTSPLWINLKEGKDSSFLNRDQTDEWKGWMQILILIYHYTGASSISPIYNLMRLLVSSYLFMTGYGHFIYFYKKSDFSLLRIGKTLLRLNLLTLVLSYIMDSPFQQYYFSPLVSVWFLIVWAVMYFGHSYNTKYVSFIVAKIILTMVLLHVFTMHYPTFEAYMGIFAKATGVRMDIKDWYFRFTLDLYIVPIGCLVACVVCKCKPWLMQIDTGKRRMLEIMSIFISIVIIVVYAFTQLTKNKFDYNTFHRYLSPFPILAFIILRNSTEYLRIYTSSLFRFFGKISLETFVLQFHIWLAMDTKGLLVVFIGNNFPLLNFAVTTFLFIFLCVHTGRATGELTDYCIKKSISGYHVALFLLLLVTFNHIP